MPRGCLLSLIAFALGCMACFYLIGNTEIQDQYWIPFVYGGLSMLTYLNLWGIVQAWQQKRSFNLPRSDWRDGTMIGITGKIRAKSKPMIAPFSRQEAVMVQYSVKFDESDGNPSDSRLCFGIMRTPCVIDFEGQSYTLAGLPFLTELSPRILLPHSAFPAAMEFVRHKNFELLTANPIKMMRESWGAFSDADGDVQTHYAMPDCKTLFVDKLESQAGDNLSGLDPFRGFRLEELCVPHGTEVSINGTYLAQQNAIDIGGGLSKTFHSLKLGPGSRPSNGPLIKSTIFGIVFSSALLGATYFLMVWPKR